MAANSQPCERAREWVSLRADGELSELESALLDAHLGRCAACERFARGAREVAAALRAAALERPAPLTLVLPHSRPALQALQAVLVTGIVVAAGAAATMVGTDRHPSPATVAKPVAVVATGDSADALRELRRPLLVARLRPAPRNRRVPPESV
jgi:predicted anti-sigma-YlaC factor YlaD